MVYSQLRKKAVVELENSKETAIQTKNEIESTGQTLDGVNGDIKGEAQRSIGSVLRKNTGSTKQEETEEEAKLLSKPYLGVTGVEYKSASSKDLPPGLDWGKGERKLGQGDKLAPKTVAKIDQKAERDTDALMTEKEGTEKLPMAEKGP